MYVCMYVCACMYVCMYAEQHTYSVSGHGVRLTESINGDLPSYTYIHMRRIVNIMWLNNWTVIRATHTYTSYVR